MAVAAQRVEDVSGEALGVNAHDGRTWFAIGGRRVDVAHHFEVPHDEGNGAFDGAARWVAGLRHAFKAEDAELAPTCGEVGIGDFGDAEQRHSTTIDSQ